MNIKHSLIAILAILLLTSCTKEINLNLDDNSGKVVIEGNITNQQGPYLVRITRSVAFTSTNQYPPVSNAFVTISNGEGVTDTLNYVSNGEYKTSKLIGVSGKTYTLKVLVDGITYTASSTMPNAVALQSLSQDSIKFGSDVNYTVLPQFTDPVSLGNRYLFIIKTAGKSEKIFEVISDNINNGVPNQRSIMLVFNNTNTNIKIEKGDTISIEMQCVSNSIYDYYSALVQLSGGGPGGGVTPSNPPSNISSGALGYFSAHSTDTKTMVIQ